jgi:hypothetical protein
MNQDPLLFLHHRSQVPAGMPLTYALIDRLTHPQHSRSALLRCAVLAYWFDNGFSRMLVRVPVRGMQGVFELEGTKKYIFSIFPCTGLSKKNTIMIGQKTDPRCSQRIYEPALREEAPLFICLTLFPVVSCTTIWRSGNYGSGSGTGAGWRSL